MVSTGDSGFSTLRRIHTRFSSSLGSSSSSLRVPLLLMSMAGNTRLSTSLRSRWISMLPVPLNSSKITSSMRLPVSISAVAMMVSDPPSSMFLAAPKKRFGRRSASAVAARSNPRRPKAPCPMGHNRVVSPRQARNGIEQNHHVALMLHQALGLLDDHLGHLHVARGRLVEGGTNHFAAHAALHVGDFFGALVDQQHDQRYLGMIGGDRIGDVLQQHRLAGAWRRNDQPALTLADGRQQVHHAARIIVAHGLKLQPLMGIQRRQVVEENLVARFLGGLKVDGVNLDQREVPL